MSDLLILKAIVYEAALTSRTNDDTAYKAAKRIIEAGFKLRDPELEARVERLEAWMRGEFT